MTLLNITYKETNRMIVKKLDQTNIPAVAIPSLFTNSVIEYTEIGAQNWADRYPYHPEVLFAIAHDNRNIYIHYKVKERCVRAVESMDLGRVWEDSCCEFFFSPEGTNGYYNLETNCIGSVLLCFGEGREGRIPASSNVLARIDRWSSLGSRSFGMKNEETEWELALKIPASALFENKQISFSGLKMLANFYKCGDKTLNPHFLSWQVVDVPNPDFHRPEFFEELTFE